MSDYPFPAQMGPSVINIGTPGGFVKASSGYAFKRTQRKIRRLADDWEATGAPNPDMLQSVRRFRLYDSILLRVLEEGRTPGARVFERLFHRLPAAHVLRFLDEDTNFKEDLKLMSVTQLHEFTRAALLQFPKYGRF
jgi:lycopene beta-cyclase